MADLLSVRSNQFKSEILSNLSHEVRRPSHGPDLTAEAAHARSPSPGRDRGPRDGPARPGDRRVFAGLVASALGPRRELAGSVCGLDALRAGDRAGVGAGGHRVGRSAARGGHSAQAHEGIAGAFVLHGIAFGSDRCQAVRRGCAAQLTSRLRLVTEHLVRNAVRFGMQGGTVTLALQAEPADDGRSRFALSVTDDGPGIEPDVFERMCEPFATQRPGLSRSQSGLGIGLAVVRMIAERFDGALECGTGPDGRGARISFSFVAESDRSGSNTAGDWALPRELLVDRPERAAQIAPAPDQTPLAPAAPADALAGRRVLVVEDEVINAKLAARTLVKAGCEVVNAYDGRQGAELHRQALATQAFGMVLMECGTRCRAF